MEDKRHTLHNEPGRRYNARQVRARAGMDVQVPPHQSSSPQPTVVPKTSNEKTKTRTVSTARPAQPRPNKSLVLKRHIVERAVEHRKQVRHERKRSAVVALVVVIVLGALGIISWSFLDFLPTFHFSSLSFLSHHQKDDTTDLKLASTLDETKPTINEIKNFQAAADEPRLLKIPKLAIEARVKRVGTSLNGEPISPSNIYDVGWFNDSVKPGQQGAVLMNGHRSGPTQKGVFHDLKTLAVNDEIQIERGDGIGMKYIIVKVQTYSGDQLDLDTVLQSIQPDKSGLNLITSSTNYDGGSVNMSERTVVFAIRQ